MKRADDGSSRKAIRDLGKVNPTPRGPIVGRLRGEGEASRLGMRAAQRSEAKRTKAAARHTEAMRRGTAPSARELAELRAHHRAAAVQALAEREAG